MSYVEFSREGKEAKLAVGHLPGRKSFRVMTIRGGAIYTHAYCRNKQEAEALVEALRELMTK